jgi:hypothetical protein
MRGRTSRLWPVMSSSAGSRMPSRRRPGNAAFAGPRRNWRKASVGPAAGQGAGTASAAADSDRRLRRIPNVLSCASDERHADHQRFRAVLSRRSVRLRSVQNEDSRAVPGPPVRTTRVPRRRDYSPSFCAPPPGGRWHNARQTAARYAAPNPSWRRPFVGAPLVQSGIDPIAQLVRLRIGEGPFQMAEHDSNEDVLLA